MTILSVGEVMGVCSVQQFHLLVLPGDHVMSGLLLTLRVVCCVQQLSLLVLPVVPVGPGLNSAYLQVCVKCPADSPRIAAWLPCGTWPPAARLLRAVWCPCGACLASRPPGAH